MYSRCLGDDWHVIFNLLQPTLIMFWVFFSVDRQRFLFGKATFGERICHNPPAWWISWKCPTLHFWDLLSHPPVHWYWHAFSKIEHELWWCGEMDCELDPQCPTRCQDWFKDGDCCHGNPTSKYVSYSCVISCIQFIQIMYEFLRFAYCWFETKISFWKIFVEHLQGRVCKLDLWIICFI